MSTSDADSPIRVVVTPSQSAYFAGEQFKVTITFTNTRTRLPETEAGPSPRPSSRTHKRAAHSISSAPLARPPTSPAGQPRPRTPTRSISTDEGSASIRRRGLIGRNLGPKGKDELPDLIEQRRSKMLAKSLSLDITTLAQVDEGVKSAPYSQRSFSADAHLSPSSPKISSPLARSDTLPISSHHPHARRQSLLDGSQFPYATSPTSTQSTANMIPSTSGPPTPSASTSTFSLALDPIAEASPSSSSPASAHPYPHPYSSGSRSASNPGPSMSSPSISVEAPSPPSPSVASYPPQPLQSRVNHGDLGLGQPPGTAPSTSASFNAPRTASSSFPQPRNTELILYSYAQLKGTVTLTPISNPSLPSAPTSASFASPFSTSTSFPRTPSSSTLFSTPLSPFFPPPPSSSQVPSSAPASSHQMSPSLQTPAPTPTTSLTPAELELQKAHTLQLLRLALLRGSATAVGGGSMDISVRTHSRTPSAGGVGVGLGGIGGGPGSVPASASAGLNSAGSWGSFGGSASASVSVNGNGVASGEASIDSGGVRAKRPQAHTRTSSLSLSSGLFGLTSLFSSPLSSSSIPSSTSDAPASGLVSSTSAPLGQDRDRGKLLYPGKTSDRNRIASASLVPSSTAGWPNSSPSPSHPGSMVPASAAPGVTSFPPLPPPLSANSSHPHLRPQSRVHSYSRSVSNSVIGSPGTGSGMGLGWPVSFSSALGGLTNSLSSLSSFSSTEPVDPELPLPTFETSPCMLGVDMMLEPGEERKFEYTIMLPEVLPPTFRGRTVRFGYELLVGICRAGGGGGGGKGNTSKGASSTPVGPAGSTSKVMKVPIRVYTNVVVGRPPTPYDLLWPLTKRRAAGTGALGHRRGGRIVSNKGNGKEADDLYAGKVVEVTTIAGLAGKRLGAAGSKVASRSKENLGINTNGSSNFSSSSGMDGLREYAKKLVLSLPDLPQPSPVVGARDVNGAAEVSQPHPSPQPSPTDTAGPDKEGSARNIGGMADTVVLDWREGQQGQDEMGGLSGCREAVEILTRNPKKVSYDVNKDGVKVAVLTFTKSAFRLGETVQGVVELNERTSRARVVQLSAHLETHESLPSLISTTPNTLAATRQLKRVHAEHHSSFVLSTLRTTFSLDIPSDASPAFQMKVGEESTNDSQSSALPPKPGGLEWKVRLCLLVAIASESSDKGTEGVRIKSLVRDGPRGEWGASWKAPKNVAPMEKPAQTSLPTSGGNSPIGNGYNSSNQSLQTKGIVRSWASFIAASFLGAAEGGYHDGDEEDEMESEFSRDDDEEGAYDGIKPDRAGGVGIGVNFAGGKEEDWKEVKVETVECEVPIRVWPGNTAFKPADVLFDV